MHLNLFPLGGLIGLISAVATPAPPAGVDLAGQPVAPLQVSTGTRAVVLFFTAPDCPIANRYAPTMSRLAAEFADSAITTWLIYADDLGDPPVIQQHQTDFRLKLPTALDHDFAIADYAGATVTPEAAVFVFSGEDRSPQLVYRGRIDDQYQGFGQFRPAATQHELHDLLTRIAAGEVPELITTKAIGCYLPRPQ